MIIDQLTSSHLYQITDVFMFFVATLGVYRVILPDDTLVYDFSLLFISKLTALYYPSCEAISTSINLVFICLMLLIAHNNSRKIVLYLRR